MKLLRYRDLRSVRRWCDNNQVRVLRDIGSNRPFVLREEFELAIEKNNKGEVVRKPSMRERFRRKYNQISEATERYKPLGENEKKVLSIFTSLI